MFNNTEVDQSRAYREYFELVQEFNSANDKYIVMAQEAEKQRQIAIDVAIRVHIDPLISTIRSVQVIGIGVGVISGLLMCVGLVDQWSGLIFMILLVTAGAGVLGFAWASSKITRLISETRKVKNELPKLSS